MDVSQRKKRIDLVIIDGQNDFLASGNESWNSMKHGGALYVQNGDQEALNVAALIKRLGAKVSKIHATMDSHHRNDCSHNVSWVGQDGSPPPPFTAVSNADVRAHRWIPTFPFGVWEGKLVPACDWAINYTKALEKIGRNQLCLWPVHCQIGRWGQNVYEPLAEAYDNWTDQTHRWVDFWTKGSWQFTEHYSAITADVPDPAIYQTQLNDAFIRNMADADLVAWSGWPGSHSLRWTALDAVNYFGVGRNDLLKKSVFLSDCCAAFVPPDANMTGLHAKCRQDFLDEVRNRGARICTSEEFMVA